MYLFIINSLNPPILLHDFSLIELTFTNSLYVNDDVGPFLILGDFFRDVPHLMAQWFLWIITWIMLIHLARRFFLTKMEFYLGTKALTQQYPNPFNMSYLNIQFKDDIIQQDNMVKINAHLTLQ
ncbi:hypothetical protein ACJX0J_030079 [Zea mays]